MKTPNYNGEVRAVKNEWRGSLFFKMFIRMPTLFSVAVNKLRSLLSLDTVIKVV